MSQILPWLFLGNMDDALNKETLEYINTKYILQVTNSCKPKFPEVSFCSRNFLENFLKFVFLQSYIYKVFNVNDMPQENLLLKFDEGLDFIHQALQTESTILVHWYPLFCLLIVDSNAGVSRSASFVIAYLIREHKMSFDEAISFVKQKRPCIFPNNGFIKQL